MHNKKINDTGSGSGTITDNWKMTTIITFQKCVIN